jgi:2-dehydro-3-deoxyglucarate aldolase
MRQENEFLKRLAEDEVVLGAQTVTHRPSIIEVYGDMGLDFIWIDFEHIGPAPQNSKTFEDLTRAAELSGIELLVRLPGNDPSLIRKVLDSGVRNLLIPRIETAADVRQAVEASKFSYENDIGERGIAASRVSGWGSELNEGYVHVEDRNTAVGVMIENTTAVENLDEILEVEGLEFVVIGPADLSVSMGYPLNDGHPEVQETIKHIQETVKTADVPVGRLASSTTEAKALIDDGARILRISSGEVAALRNVVEPRFDELAEFTGAERE